MDCHYARGFHDGGGNDIKKYNFIFTGWVWVDAIGEHMVFRHVLGVCAGDASGQGTHGLSSHVLDDARESGNDGDYYHTFIEKNVRK